MIPRRDPETCPAAANVQLLSRKHADQYGTGHGKFPTYRPFQTRNGLPVRLYEYRGSGESMTTEEAATWLSGT